VNFDIIFILKIFTTQATAKPFEARVRRLMLFQFVTGKETLLTFIANVRLHSVMSLYVFLKAIFATELRLTDATRELKKFLHSLTAADVYSADYATDNAVHRISDLLENTSVTH